VIACDTPGQLKAAVDRTARIELVWHRDPPRDNPDVDALARSAEIHGQRWIIRVERDQVPEMVARLTGDGLYEWVDDFAVSSASLEDVYLALGGRHADFLPAAVE
jgi:ABC-2 type transport system ATP-binding protein